MPERSPEAAPEGVRELVVVASVAERGPVLPAATVGMSAATAIEGTPVVVVFFRMPVDRAARDWPLRR